MGSSEKSKVELAQRALDILKQARGEALEKVVSIRHDFDDFIPIKVTIVGESGEEFVVVGNYASIILRGR